MTPQDKDAISTLHDAYKRATGLDISLNMGRIFVWESWMVRGFALSDLVAVVAYIQGKIKRKERREESLRFTNLIQDADRFELDKAEMEKALNLRVKAARPVPAAPKRVDGREMPATPAGAHTERAASETAIKLLQDFRKSL